MKKGAWVAFLVLVMAGMGWAVVQNAAPPAAEAQPLANTLGLKGLVKGLLIGAVVGALVALAGWAKDKDKKQWDWDQAAPTLIWGAIVGALAGMGQKDIGDLDALKDNAAYVIIAELLGKVGFRKGAPVIGNVVATFLGKKPEAPKS